MDAKQVVINCIEAVNNGNYTEARKYVTADMRFVGVFGATDGGDDYVDYLEKKHIRYQVHKVFADGNDVCVLYDLLMGPHAIYGCGWYTLTDSKVSLLKVVFDPRPMM